MVRPLKLGIDYFPMDTDMDQDDKILMIEAKYPDKGFEIITKLFMKIYKEGYYYQWGEKEQLLFTNKIPNVNTKYVNDVINDAIKWELFDQNIYKKYNILTSNGIQKRYLEAIKRRKEVEIISEYWVNDNNNEYNENINFKKLYNSTQSKVKESKPKQKEKESKQKYGDYKNVLLKNSEYDKLKTEYPNDIKNIIQDFSERKEMKGYKYKSDYLAMKKWGIKTYFEQNPKTKDINWESLRSC